MEHIKIMLVDDHPVIREGLRAMLRTDPDLEVVAEAGDGLEAVQMTAEHNPQVILMDVRMPNLDGLEASRRIKAEFPSTVIIMLSIYDDDAYIVDAVRAGASGYLLKDASRDLLVYTIRAVSSGGILFRSGLLREAVAGILGPEGLQAKGGRHRGFEELSPREREVLMVLVEGRTNKEIGEALLISEDTAKKHVQSIIGKLGAADRTQAAVKALRAGLVK